jgi:CRISPR/Cas system-associated endoribonuclease Cas2
LTAFIVTYDVRAKNHDYTGLYSLLSQWRAAHLQNSVWLVDLNGSAINIREALKQHMHADDTIAVIQLPVASCAWATQHVRAEGLDWLKARWP